MELSFTDLLYRVPLRTVRSQAKGKEDEEAPEVPLTKTILQGINGACKAGKLQAIMGPSGAGKTTLLDILAGRKPQSSGELKLGTELATRTMIRRHAAYVQQDDAIMASQTAREAVQMAALLTLPADMAREAKLAHADKVLKEFELEACADTPVGDPVGNVKGLSGGERKRCAVAMSVVREPKILFLDEPTSGLDAFKAHLLIKIIKDLAQRTHSTIVCTIHQPSSDIFALFDNLMLLLDGQVVFNGGAVDAVTHFATAGFPCPQYANPADFLFMHVLTSEDGSSAASERRRQLVEAWDGSSLNEGKPKNEPVPNSVSMSPSRAESAKVPGFTITFPTLLKRGFNDLKRNKMRARAPFGQSIAMAIMLGLIWWDVGNDQKGIQDRVGVIFFMVINGIMQNVMGVLTTFANERGAVLREQENGMYTTLPYFCARVLVDMPVKILCPAIFSAGTYWMGGFQADAEKFLICVVFNILLALAGNSIGLFLACVFPDVAVALAVAPLMLMPLIMFSGYVLNTDSIPVYFQWLEWLSPPKYAFAAVVQTEFDGLKLHCLDNQWREVRTSNNTYVKVCPFEAGSGPDGFLSTLNIQESLTVPNCALFLIILTVGFMGLAYAALVRISTKAKAQTSS